MNKLNLVSLAIFLAASSTQAIASDPSKDQCLKLDANNQSEIMASVTACYAWNQNWKKTGERAKLSEAGVKAAVLNNAISNAADWCKIPGYVRPQHPGETLGPNHPKCIQYANEVSEALAPLKTAGGAAAAPQAAAQAPAPAAGANPDYDRFNRISSALDKKLSTYSGADADDLKSKLQLVKGSVNRLCADPSTDACANALKNGLGPLNVIAKKVQGGAGAAAAPTNKAKVVSLPRTAMRQKP